MCKIKGKVLFMKIRNKREEEGGSFHIKWTPLRPAKSPIWLKIGYVVLMTHTNKK